MLAKGTTKSNAETEDTGSIPELEDPEEGMGNLSDILPGESHDRGILAGYGP